VKPATKTAMAGFDAARRKTSMKAAQKLTDLVDGHYQFREEPATAVPGRGQRR
jgi:hypothetical protein